MRTHWFVPFAALAAARGWFAVHYQFDIRSQRHIDSIVAATPAEIQNIQFENDATLLGARTVPVFDGGIVLELVWKLKEGRRSIRFPRLLGEEQNIMGRGHANQELFANVGDDIVIDRVRIGPNQMEGVCRISVGFFDWKRFAALVDCGPRGPKNRQLYIWESK